jgi:uncharacterized delta-60 repeat protein
VYEPAAAAARILRYLPNGQLDPTFGEGGILETAFGLPVPEGEGVQLATKPVVEPLGVGVDAAGRIVITGRAAAGLRNFPCYHDAFFAHITYAAFVARLTGSGGPDTGFGSEDGVFGGRSAAENPLRMEAAADPTNTPGGGVIFLRGPGNCARSEGAPGLIQLTVDGTPFNSSERNPGRPILAAAIAPDGSVALLEGRNYRFRPPGPQRVARLRPDGTLDRSFGRAGRVKPHLPDEGYAVSIAVDSRGRILLAGTKFPGSRPRPSVAHRVPPRALLARLRPGGPPDKSFGTDGTVITPIPRLSIVENLWLDQAGRPTVTGRVGRHGNGSGLVAFRYALR